MAIDITRQIDFSIRWSTAFEMEMLSIQRVLEYTRLAPETENRQVKRIEDGDQFRGKIDFQNVNMSYRPELQPALKHLSFDVKAGEKVAVVGRTGAGKSTLYQLLLGFRVANEGRVQLDDKDLKYIDLNVLREQINVVLQHPFVVATDTIRENLDPKGQFSDYELEKALTDAAFDRQMKIKSNELASRLSSQADDCGHVPQGYKELNLDSLATDLSSGQQQLLTLAYSLLQKQCSVTLLDEPTA